MIVRNRSRIADIPIIPPTSLSLYQHAQLSSHRRIIIPSPVSLIFKNFRLIIAPHPCIVSLHITQTLLHTFPRAYQIWDNDLCLRISIHFGLWIFKLALFWMVSYIDRITPAFSPWIIVIQFSGLAVMACPRFPLVCMLTFSLMSS